jgi:hypothetical protein
MLDLPSPVVVGIILGLLIGIPGLYGLITATTDFRPLKRKWLERDARSA